MVYQIMHLLDTIFKAGVSGTDKKNLLLKLRCDKIVYTTLGD